MSIPIILTEAELAELLKIEPEQARRLRWKHDWPHLGIGKHVRYTEAQVEAILALHTHMPEPMAPPLHVVPGQSARSAAYHRRQRP